MTEIKDLWVEEFLSVSSGPPYISACGFSPFSSAVSVFHSTSFCTSLCERPIYPHQAEQGF